MTPTSWLITGAAGQVGTHVVAELRRGGDEVVALTRAELDITSAAAVDEVIARHRPDVVINTAAYTAVDNAECDEPAAAQANATAPGLIAAALARHGGRLVHVSTDYVFAGDASEPYDVHDPVGPQTAYGRTKLAGERAALAALPDRTVVVRTAWVYGGPGPNFVDTMLRLEGERDTVDVVADQHGNPTSSRELAAALVAAGRVGVGGVLHYVNAGHTSWYGLARETFRLVGADPGRVRRTDSAAFARPAKRPAWSVLSTRSWTAAGLPAPRPWTDALADQLARSGRTPSGPGRSRHL